MPDELIDIYDKNQNKIGTEMKSVVHKKGLWHRAVWVWVYNSMGEVLLQKRAKDKKLFPNLWDVSAAGHVGAGEDSIVAACREVKEELDIEVGSEDLKKFGIHKVDIFEPTFKLHNREFAHVYFFRHDGGIAGLKIQKEELEEIKFIPLSEWEAELTDSNKVKKYVPHGQYYFEIIKALEVELKKKVNNDSD